MLPIYIKTEYSLLNSMVKIKELINIAKLYNYDALTITDNNMFGAMEFYKECKKNNIKPIIGLELKLEDKIFILYCKNYNGYKNLIKISTISSEREITYKDIEKYYSDLICIVPYTSRLIYKELNKIFDDIFIGYKNKDELTHLKGDNLIYLNEILYLLPEDGNYYRYLQGIRTGKSIEEIDISNDKYLKTIEEITNKYPETIKNYKYIYNNCNLEIESHDNLIPNYKVPDNYDTVKYLKHLCKEGLKKRFGDKVNKIYIDRLKYELEIINNMGFSNYFLIVRDYVKFAKENNILVGPGRGSAAGSLVSYVLEITDIDPIKYNLLFERFLNPERATMPDIDIDFEYDRREEVINYCIDKYGIKKVAGIVTFGTLASKQAIRDVGRVMNIEINIIDNICKLLDSKLSLSENKKNKKIEKILKDNKEINKLYLIAMKLEGLKRHTSVHASGIVMCECDIDEIVPLYKHDDMFITAYSMNYLEELGLLKMDFLGLKNLNIISNIIENLNKDEVDINFNDIPLNDNKALQIFNKANTIGIFQFESEGMINFIRKFKPTSFEDLFSAIALYRPGPMENIDTFIRRKYGKEKIDYYDKSLEHILKPTYGIIIYQEQIMQISNVMAGYSLGEADILRRAMSKKKEEILLKEKDKFITRSIKNGYSEELSTKIYDLILKFASYGFNRSHSVAYSIIAYKMAYLKAHYPSYFMECLLDNSVGNSISIKKYIYECRINNIKILPPNINISDKKYKVENNSIRFPLTSIKNVGIIAVNEIIEERKKGKFKDIYDFVKRCYNKNVNKKIIINLIKANCFSEFDYNKKTLVENIDLITNYIDVIRDIDEEFALKPVLENYEEYTKEELMNNELELFGFYLTNNPITDYKIKYNSISLNEISNYFDKKINIVLMVDRIKEISAKSGDKMCFLTLSDELSTIDGVLFPKIYSENKQIKEGNILLIDSRVEKRFDKFQLVINKTDILK